MANLLKGVKVVGLDTYAAAPAVGRILACMGADVVKIEPPSGDPYRGFGKNVGAPTTAEENPCYQLDNANKRCIAINMKAPEGMDVFYDMLKGANIFFTNNRMDALRRMKISYEDLKDRFPHLIYGHISGYGLKGEDSVLPGFDMTAFWARGGALADFPTAGNGPMAIPYGVGDHAASLALSAGLLAALNHQRDTGKGEYVLVSLFGTAVWLNSLMLVPVQYDDRWPKSRFAPATPLSNTYVCKCGEMVTLAVLDYARDWPKFCKVIDREDLVTSPDYCQAVEVKKPANNEALCRVLMDIFITQDRSYWLKRLRENDVPFSKTQHMREVIDDQLAWDNEYLSKFTYDNGNTTAVPNVPMQFGGNKAEPCLRAPDTGQHSKEVLAELGYDAAKIQSLLDAKAVVQK
jgi:crotonobetainyl-CoA:carnitine CoA-transferase CaiB-like acyl-CoA transferase